MRSRILSRQQPVRGAYTDLSELIGLRFAASQLSMRVDQKARATLAGTRSTKMRGRGIEFEEVRQYQAGDDIRTIDWRVTARSGTPHTRLFREERERPTLICIDQRQSMFFGSRNTFKSCVAAHVAALAGWATLEAGDRVGGLVFNDHAHSDIRARRHRESVLQFLNEINRFNHQLNAAAGGSPKPFSDVLKELQRIAKPGYQIILISDFHGLTTVSGQHDRDDCTKKLSQLAQHCELSAVFICDQLEAELPPPGRYGISDGQHQLVLDATGHDRRRRFHAAFEQHEHELRQRLGRHGIPVLNVRTDDIVLAKLQQFWGGRGR